MPLDRPGAAGSISTFSLFQGVPSNLKAGSECACRRGFRLYSIVVPCATCLCDKGEFNIYKCAAENTIMSKFEAQGPIKLCAMIALVNFILCDWSKRAV